ncbi:hypothetical protein DFQ28_000217 [Apophysomyces sp. BC1034]|nr:hypothetical protein DFQ30_002171 [Apophysomyces sp. BC1015]KAG0176770.1 hypothetical protein DFQ29_005655 [Apophysomyces sp. BC1021]KAG0184056.1 hypothetical protein DFQ28_000217 [Apophysomyces sp. BC1034]
MALFSQLASRLSLSRRKKPQPTTTTTSPQDEEDPQDPAHVSPEESQPSADSSQADQSSTTLQDEVPPATTTNVDFDHLEFAASRDFAHTFGSEWATVKNDNLNFPAFDYLLNAPAPIKPASTKSTLSRRLGSAFRSLPRKDSVGTGTAGPSAGRRHRLSLYRPKSTMLLKKSRSTPDFAKVSSSS